MYTETTKDMLAELADRQAIRDLIEAEPAHLFVKLSSSTLSVAADRDGELSRMTELPIPVNSPWQPRA